MSKIVLPRVYNDPFGNYPQHKGKPKLSYSQYTSFIDDLYRGNYIGGYFLGQWDEGNIFSEFGGRCGKWWEEEDGEGLSESDIEILQNTLPRPDSARYEVEIVIDRGLYCIQGFIDFELEVEPGVIEVIDLKTGNHKDKPDFYASDSYQQTTLYSYQREKEGMKIGYSGVKLLERKGNGSEKHPLRLSGELLDIPTPYSRERAEAFLKKMDEVAKQISEYYKFYNKYFK